VGESAPAGQQGHEELLTKLSLEDKISLLTGADHWHLRAHPGIGLRRIRTSDGHQGDVRLRRGRAGLRDTTVAGLSATCGNTVDTVTIQG
jgi:hypothetical protein